MAKLSENVDLINAKIEGLKDMSPGSATSNEAGLCAENGEEIKKSARKLELCFPVELEMSAAKEEVKKALAAAGKTLDELKGKIEGDEFYAEENFTKVVIGFNNVAIRKDAQAVVCLHFTNGTWKGSKLTRPSGGAIWVRVQKPPFARRRDARLNAFQRALMATTLKFFSLILLRS